MVDINRDKEYINPFFAEYDLLDFPETEQEEEEEEIVDIEIKPEEEETVVDTTAIQEDEEEETVPTESEYINPFLADENLLDLSETPAPTPVKPQIDELPESIGESITTPETVEEMPKMSYEDAAQDEEFISAIRAYARDRGDDLGYDPTEIDTMSNDELLEDWMDHYRWSTTNTITAASTGNYVYKLSKDYDNAVASGDTEKATQLRDKLQNVSTLLSKTDQVATIFDSERYKDKGYLAAAGDIVETVGSYLASTILDPLTVASAGVGKIVAVNAIKSAASTPLKSALKSALASAPIDAAASAYVDTQVQGMYIEAGLQDEYDYGRTAAIASGSAILSSVLGTGGTYMALKSEPKLAAGSLSERAKNAKKITGEKATAKAAENSEIGREVRDRLVEEINSMYGKGAIKTKKNGEIIGINYDKISESRIAKNSFVSELAPDAIESRMGVDSIKRVVAATIDSLTAIREGRLKIDPSKAVKPELKLEELMAPLAKGERVTQRFMNIMANVDKESKKILSDIAGQYYVTPKELAATVAIEFSDAGKTLAEARKFSRLLGEYKKSVDEIEYEKEIKELEEGTRSYIRRGIDIFRGLLVTGIATTVRNTAGNTIRVPMESNVWLMEQAIKKLTGKEAGITPRGYLSQYDFLFRDRETAAEIREFFLSGNKTQSDRYYQNFIDTVDTLKKENPAQGASSNIENPVKEATTADKLFTFMEKGVRMLNAFNYHQDAVARNAAFATFIERKLIQSGRSISDFKDMSKYGEIAQIIDDETIAKGVDFALKASYAARPETRASNAVLQLFNSVPPLMFLQPFPRFMLYAMEMSWNYNIVTGLPTTLLRSAAAKARGGEALSDELITKYSQAVAGGAPLLLFSYYLTDPENGLIGNNWYDVKVGNNTIDARYFFPLTPFLYTTTLMHRAMNGEKLGDLREFTEAVTGTGFRGTQFGTELFEIFFQESEKTPGQEVDFWKTAGELVGNTLLGFGTPIWQLGDAKIHSEYVRYVTTDDDYDNALSAFFDGVSERFMNKITTMTGGGEEYPYRYDPREPDPPERAMPFMKLFFGTNLNRLPPEYMVNLSRWGYKYTDFMAKGPNDQFNNVVNKYMGQAMRRDLPELLQLLESEGLTKKQQVALIDNHIADMKAESKAFAETQSGRDVPELKYLVKFTRYRISARKAAMEMFEKEYGRKPDRRSIEDLDKLITYADNIKGTKFTR